MKKTLIFFTFTLLFIVSGHSQSIDIELEKTDNTWVNIDELKGKNLTVIDFWATWCKPCLNAIPKINTLYDQFKNEGVQFIGANIDGARNKGRVLPFTKSLNVNYPVVFDSDKELYSILNVVSLPTLVILNSQGSEVYRHEGFSPGDELEIKEKIESLLK